jgi:uncharacterized protein
MSKTLWRKIHRWLGLLLTALLFFYSFTGLLLNHRQHFKYFQTEETTVSQIEMQEQQALLQFIANWKQQIGRQDDPTVIRIKRGGVVELLYGSHGRTTYTIDPQAGTLTRTDKIDQQPWHWLNRLHQAAKTSNAWLILADSVVLLIAALLLSGLLLVRLRRQDIILLIAGLALLLLGMAAA